MVPHLLPVTFSCMNGTVSRVSILFYLYLSLCQFYTIFTTITVLIDTNIEYLEMSFSLHSSSFSLKTDLAVIGLLCLCVDFIIWLLRFIKKHIDIFTEITLKLYFNLLINILWFWLSIDEHGIILWVLNLFINDLQ